MTRLAGFYKAHELFQKYSDISTDYFIKSWKYPYNSDNWKFCRLKMEAFNKSAMEYLDKANEELKKVCQQLTNSNK